MEHSIKAGLMITSASDYNMEICRGGADNFLDQKEQGEEKHGIYGTRKRTSSRPI